MNRTFLHEQGYGPFFSAFDPFRNIQLARRDHGWIIDYCHCPLEKAVHPNKGCSEAQLRQRFEAVLSEGGDAVWCANPDEVIYYHTTRRHTRIEPVRQTEEEQVYRLAFENLPEQVISRALTLEAQVPAAWCQNPVVWVNGQAARPELARPRHLRLTLDVSDGTELKFGPYRAPGG